MSEHDPSITFKQMLSSAREALEISRGKSREDLDNDRLLNLALTRLVEIIGESANRIPVSEREKYPDLPWVQMIGARNRLIHGYDNVDFDVLWAIIQNDLPRLVSRLNEIVKS